MFEVLVLVNLLVLLSATSTKDGPPNEMAITESATTLRAELQVIEQRRHRVQQELAHALREEAWELAESGVEGMGWPKNSARSHMLEALKLRPNDPDMWIDYGQLSSFFANDLASTAEALRAFTNAVNVDPIRAAVLGINATSIAQRRQGLAVLGKRSTETEEDRSPQIPPWFIPMLNDPRRNTAFYAAIRAILERPQSSTRIIATRVLDIGTGAGLLAMMAGEVGGPRVSVAAIELVPRLAAVARANIARNGLGDRVRVLTNLSTTLTAVDLPDGQRCDVLVSEVLDNGLIGPSDWLGTLAHAQRHLLRPRLLAAPPALPAASPRESERRFRVVPATATVRVLFIESPQLRHYFHVPATIDGLDVSALRTLRPASDATAYETIDLDGLRYRSLTAMEVIVQRWDFEAPIAAALAAADNLSAWRPVHCPNGGASPEECSSSARRGGDGALLDSLAFSSAGVLDAIVVLWDAQLVHVIPDDSAVSGKQCRTTGVAAALPTHACATRSPSPIQISNRPYYADTGGNETGRWQQNHWQQPAQIFRNGGIPVRAGAFHLSTRHDRTRFFFRVKQPDAVVIADTPNRL